MQSHPMDNACAIYVGYPSPRVRPRREKHHGGGASSILDTTLHLDREWKKHGRQEEHAQTIPHVRIACAKRDPFVLSLAGDSSGAPTTAPR